MEGSPAQQILADAAALLALRAGAAALEAARDAVGLPREEALAALLGNLDTTAFRVRAARVRP